MVNVFKGLVVINVQYGNGVRVLIAIGLGVLVVRQSALIPICATIMRMRFQFAAIVFITFLNASGNIIFVFVDIFPMFPVIVVRVLFAGALFTLTATIKRFTVCMFLLTTTPTLALSRVHMFVAIQFASIRRHRQRKNTEDKHRNEQIREQTFDLHV